MVVEFDIFAEKTEEKGPPSANKAAHSSFETERGHHQKSKAEVSVASYKKEMCPPKIKKKVLIEGTVEKVPSFRSNETGLIKFGRLIQSNKWC